ncbi:hypothetical protein [Bradyrhizobium sp. JYMT SZCCT0180]|uniref:hypothetical protein n=1 Tax=Bradyrhizobium sp. JYMT SZCCT0180 TaxID=2807666 RepID=UPI001BABAB73|nr:hypothetical protein [Bradyrhizobium sp. JYMT SZCCT0180]MBR1209639.1 hypothetical protein [Bradyrhizobium sp. JYMT SZCCT0180]
MIEPRSRGVLDRPVKPGDDSKGCLKIESEHLPAGALPRRKGKPRTDRQQKCRRSLAGIFV